MKTKTLTLFGALALGQAVAPAQPVPVPTQGVGAMHLPVMHGHGQIMPAPLVAAKFIVPKDVRVTAYPGSSMSRMYDTPITMGLRPGYRYRFELSNLPYHPGTSLFPEVELRGTLVPRPGMKYMDFPIPLAFSQEDIEKVLKGAVITKVIYLEDPEKALPAEVGPNAPVELPDSNDEAAIKAALASGRVMAIVRVGNLKMTPAQLMPLAIDGTILLPGEQRLKMPMQPPVLQYFATPLYDPRLGKKVPQEECFLDGGDRNDPLGIGPNDRLGGLNPTDVGVEYTIGGRRKVTTSNVACICAPRFMIRRAELLPGGIDLHVRASTNVGTMGTSYVRERQAAMVDIAHVRPGGMEAKVQASVFVGKVGMGFFIGSTRPMALGQVDGVKVIGELVEPEQLTAFPLLRPLTVTKRVDPPGPKESGEIVTITIQFANTGSKPIDDLVVSDSLSGRLEYMPGSAQSDRPAIFTTAVNEVGSVVARWELPGRLLPGQRGTVKFKAKVR